MNPRWVTAVIITAVVVAAPACSAVQPNQTYSSMLDLAYDAGEAGLTCEGYQNRATPNSTMLRCDDSRALVFRFLTPGGAQQWVEQRVYDQATGGALASLRGPNWVIVAPESTLNQVARVMGGSITPGPAALTTPTPDPTASSATTGDDPVTFSIECGDEVFATLEEAWAYDGREKLDYCEASWESGDTYTDQQTRAVEVADYDSVDDLDVLYGLCAQVDGQYTEKGWEYTRDQLAEVRGMLVLCPGFPKAARVKANIKLTRLHAKERDAGTRFGDGDYRVGKDIRPGTYSIRKTDDEGCYWERLNRSGDIIDNNFVNARTRVQVTIRSTDYTFSSERCGEWSRA